MSAIDFCAEEIDYTLNDSFRIIQWLEDVATSENVILEELTYIFCSDEYILEINKSHLNHDYFTDIITFDNSFEGDNIMGDIYISIDTVTDNARTYNVTFDQELHRVMVHGLLHLCGYNDKTETEQNQMTEKENFYLSQLLN
jgi:probable rRNA maturation factor